VLLATAAVAIAVIPAGSAAYAADPITPVAPISPIGASFDPIAPIDPLDADEPENQAGPQAPRAPRAPQSPSLDGVTDVQTRIAEITGMIGGLLGRLNSFGVSDGAFDGPAANAALDALQDGRETLAGPVDAPQVEVGTDGCPTSAPEGSLRDGAQDIGVAQLCADSVAQAATPEAAKAITWAFAQLGAPYACGGVGRMNPYRFDCSSLVTRAYSEGAGLNTATDTYAPSTRDLLPWGGVKLADWAVEVGAASVRPGDLLVYRTCTKEPCSYQHVTMALADGYMLHTNRCGDVAHVTRSWGTGEGSKFAVARRVDPAKA
jgi:hypothetical protein